MEVVKLKYGEKIVELTIEGAKSIQYLHGKDIEEIKDLRSVFLNEIEKKCVESEPLKKIIAKNDLVTIVVSDLTRFWMRQDLVCDLLVAYLHEEMQIPYDNIVILVALGTHRDMTEEELEKVASPAAYSKVKVLNHNAMAENLKYVGTTSRGTEVIVNPLVVDRKVIIVGGTVHHVMAGFGGGRKSILPGISSKKTINQNHINSLDPDEAMSNPLIGMGKLKDNPVHEDMTEGAALVNPVFGINIVANPNAKPCRIVCGHWLKAWETSTTIVNDYFGVPIEKKADIVIASCGGYPKDINLYQGVKTLFNAAEAIKEGGTMILLAECREGGGAPDFFDWINSVKTQSLDADLRARFTIAGYIFYAACEAINKCEKVFMLSSIPSETVKDMNLLSFSDLNSLLNQVDFTGKDVHIMPYGGSTVPLEKK
ncbi:nickel-dependent lactate racemase [Alkalibaculum bacchi]|uniref:nickel-dependent lactate racemase n=1 Tax=Alkalibaculum bacchi TaxID=645887 RepID=UPI0026ED963F|nr:nickel-dependent lactate racemase [Alkalibaculum bacchi]